MPSPSALLIYLSFHTCLVVPCAWRICPVPLWMDGYSEGLDCSVALDPSHLHAARGSVTACFGTLWNSPLLCHHSACPEESVSFLRHEGEAWKSCLFWTEPSRALSDRLLYLWQQTGPQCKSTRETAGFAWRSLLPLPSQGHTWLPRRLPSPHPFPRTSLSDCFLLQVSTL